MYQHMFEAEPFKKENPSDGEPLIQLTWFGLERVFVPEDIGPEDLGRIILTMFAEMWEEAHA